MNRLFGFTNGESVRILRGPFSQFTGSVREIDIEKRALKVEVAILGTATHIEAFFLDVQKLKSEGNARQN